ncbi:hypothetical protein Tco_1015473 [Tanacetum coccineum]|uniref:Uncharacterized protein n=1 Tax=Tanacetum coccineum TaxID=301880 RepID=A0ABQ5FM87_9ASTR
MTPENKEQLFMKKEAIFLLLTSIGDEIYSTVDACNTANEMWIAIERLQQGESLNVQDVKTNLFWEFRKFTSRDGESMESYYSRFNQNGQDDIYSTVDACNTANEMWIAIERLQQGESFNVQDVKTNLFWEFGKNNLQVTTMQVNVQFLQQLQPEWSRFVTIVKQAEKIDIVSYHRLFDILKQFQLKVNDIRSERIAKSANPLALIAAAQPYSDNYYQAPKPQRSNATSSSKRPSASTNPNAKNRQTNYTTHLIGSVSDEDSDPEQAQRTRKCKRICQLLHCKVISEISTNLLPTQLELSFSNSKNKTEDTTTKEGPVVQHAWDTCIKLQGVSLQAEQADWLKDTDEEIDEQELEAHYSYMAKIQDVSPEGTSSTGQPLEQHPNAPTKNGRPTFANPRYLKKAQSEKPCLYEIPFDTSDPANRFAPEREETTTLDNESRSKLNKDYVKPYDYTKQNSLYEIFKGPSLEYLYQLERGKEVRKTMWRKPFVRTKPNIAKNVAFLPVSKSISKSRQVFNEMTFNINQFREIVDQTWFKHTSDYFRVPTAHDMELLIQTFLMPLSIKSQNDSFRFEHELKTEMHEDFEYVKSLEKEIDELESEKADFSNIYDLLLEECVSKDVICSYLHSLSDLNAHTGLQCLYLHKVKECECLAQKLSKQTESVNKEVHNNLLKSFSKLEKHSISLELALQQCKEQMKNNSVCKENGSNVFRKEREQYHEIQDLKAQMQDKNIAISELKKLIEKCKGKSVETQFDKPSVVRQPNAQRIPKPSVLGKPTPFSNSPEMRSFQTKQSVNKTNVSDGLFNQVTLQNLPQNRKQAEIHSNVLKPGMHRIATSTKQNREPQLPHASRNTNPHVSKSTGVTHPTSVSRPQLKSYQVKDKVVPNISQVKFTKKEVEDHHRISSISKKTKSVTVCNNTTNSRTSNVNAVCAECGKCVFNSNHDACVSRYLNVMNARTKKPNVVPIGDSKPKRKANKSVATTHKKTVASDTTIQKPKSYFKELWIPTGKLFNSCTGKVDSEPTHVSIVDIPHIHESKQTLGLSAGISFNGQKQQRIDLNADALYNEKQENLRVWTRSLMFTRRLIVADQASVFMAMTFEQRNSSLVLHQMTSDHNRSEFGIQVYSNEQSSLKLVPKVVPSANKTATSRQELELLFHLHIAMLRTTGLHKDGDADASFQ